eukprot:3941946-Rhodomonas_salina.9
MMLPGLLARGITPSCRLSFHETEGAINGTTGGGGGAKPLRAGGQVRLLCSCAYLHSISRRFIATVPSPYEHNGTSSYQRVSADEELADRGSGATEYCSLCGCSVPSPLSSYALATRYPVLTRHVPVPGKDCKTLAEAEQPDRDKDSTISGGVWGAGSWGEAEGGAQEWTFLGLGSERRHVTRVRGSDVQLSRPQLITEAIGKLQLGEQEVDASSGSLDSVGGESDVDARTGC